MTASVPASWRQSTAMAGDFTVGGDAVDSEPVQCGAHRSCFRVGVASGATAITTNPCEIAGPGGTCCNLTNFREDLDSTVGV
jgi:hypothetical protein